MNPNPKVSIITVCYQAEPFLESTLQSAIGQTFQDFELVIIDGGSTDRTLSIANRFKAKIGYIVSEKDNGIYDAMNKGILHAKGEWLYFLNAGDRFYTDQVLETIFRNPIPENIGLMYGKVQTVNEPTGINYIAGREVVLQDFFHTYPINHQSTFTRKSAFTVVGLFQLNYKLAADTEWFIRFFKQTEFVPLFVNEIIAYYDIQGATYTKRMKGYKEYLNFGRRHFPWYISVLNHLLYPVIWLKVKLIRVFTGTVLFSYYRKLKYKLI